MKFSKNWKRFCDLSRRSEGFTLVELIVVIAILAILAGVATAGYSGYIKKANEAADLDTLYAINTAFAAACIDNGTDATMINAAAIDLATGTLTKVGNLDDTKRGAVNTSFAKFLGSTGEIKFKTITGLLFDAGKHQFVDAKSESVTVAYRGNLITLSGADAQVFASSSLGAIGPEALLGQVDLVASLGTAMMGEGGALSGVDFETAINELYGDAGAYDALVMQKLEQMAVDNPDVMANPMNYLADAENAVKANSAVLSAAQNAVAMDKADITALLGSEGAMDTIMANLDNSTTAEQGLAEAALAYGMVTAYAQSTGDTDLLNTLQDPNNANSINVVKTAVNSAEFREYVNSDQGSADLDGYLAALNIIDSSANSNTDAVTDVLVNGFDNEDLAELLSGLTGN